MHKEQTMFYDSRGELICFYDVLRNLKTNKHYIVLPFGRDMWNTVIARLSLKTGKPSSKVRYPFDQSISTEYEIIGSRRLINE